MEIELRDLRYFLAVAQLESITKAADYLFIAQPSLSRRMQKLESELDKKLFIRGSRKVTLTQAGLLLKKRAEEMLQLYEKTQSELLADGENLSGDVYIGGGESCSGRIVARAAKEIMSKHPEVKFHFFSGDTHDVKDKLDKGLIDFGVFVEPSELADYDYVRLPAADTWGVLMLKISELAKKESVTADDLKCLPLICSRHSVIKKALDEWFSAADCKPKINVTYNLIYNASLMVEEGMGYARQADKHGGNRFVLPPAGASSGSAACGRLEKASDNVQSVGSLSQRLEKSNITRIEKLRKNMEFKRAPPAGKRAAEKA